MLRVLRTDRWVFPILITAALGVITSPCSAQVEWESRGDVPRAEYERCLDKAAEFTKRCDEVANRWATEDCRRSNNQSDCLNWKVGCFSPYTPGWVFSEANCAKLGFHECAAAVYPGYIGCIESCNTAKDRFDCLHSRCQAQAKAMLDPCGRVGATGSGWLEPTGGSPDAQPGTGAIAIAGGQLGGTISQPGGIPTAGRGDLILLCGGVEVHPGGRMPMVPSGYPAPCVVSIPPPGYPVPSAGPLSQMPMTPSGYPVPSDGPLSQVPMTPSGYPLPSDVPLSRMSIPPLGYPLPADMTIRAIAPAMLLLPDGTSITMGPHAEIMYEQEKHQAVVQTGKVIFDHAVDIAMNQAWQAAKNAAGRQWRALKVMMTGAKVGLVGTRFLVDVDPDSRIERILVREGEVEIEGRVSGRVRVPAGSQVVVRSGVLESAQPVSDADWVAENRELVGEASSAMSSVAGSTAPAGSTGLSSGVASRSGSGGCDGIHGPWRWFNGAMVECSAAGRCEASNGFGGPWRCLDGGGRFEIQWGRPGQQTPYVDTLEISPDGWELTGVNQSGQGVGGQRPEFTGGDPQSGCRAILGHWRWSGGTVVDCTADGNCIASNGLSGPWRCINESGRFEIRWGRPGRPNQFTDTLLVSPLGTYLSGKNQHGIAMGAARE